MNRHVSWRLCCFWVAATAALIGSGSQTRAEALAAADQPGAAAPAQRDCPDECPEMVLVPPGEFTMGSPITEDGRDHQEGPRHKVTISNGLLVGKYDITVRQFARFVTDTHYDAGACSDHPNLSWRNPGFEQSDTSPVVCVNFRDAQAYTAWLTKKTGHAYRLLSESEYEYVNRAGTSTAFWWGSTVGVNNANCAGCGSAWDNKRTSPVGSFHANPFGLYDTTGNVYAWVSDCWNDTYVNPPTDGSPATSGDCSMRGLRGAGWGSPLPHVRVAFRLADPSGNRYNNMGFRVARSP
jgi:formylglycine-generating enzyme required for sulfatase activity